MMTNKSMCSMVGMATLVISLSISVCNGDIGEKTAAANESASSISANEQQQAAGNTEIDYPLRGITADSVENLDALVMSIKDQTAKPSIRIVFDPENAVSDYAAAIDELGRIAFLMGELIDSDSMTLYSVDQVRDRAEDFITAYGGQIDIWEIGNELNGEWVGKDPAEINEKVQAAYDVISKSQHGKTAITMNYWSGPDCYDQSWEPTLEYAQSIPDEIRNGVHYLFLSIYETACDPIQQPTAREIGTMLVELGKLFPRAKLGIGEVGAQGKSDGFPAPTYSEKVHIARRYYGMHDQLKELVGDRFVGGYFWWYYCEDALPKDGQGSLWQVLNELLAGLK